MQCRPERSRDEVTAKSKDPYPTIEQHRKSLHRISRIGHWNDPSEVQFVHICIDKRLRAAFGWPHFVGW